MKLNTSFIENIQSAYGDNGKLWLSNLTNHLDKLAEQWNFQMLQPIEDLSYNFVAIVEFPFGKAILKTAPPSVSLMPEAEWLKVHEQRTPVIYQVDNINNAFFMEKLEPGNSLKEIVTQGDDEKATRIIAQVILDLQSSTSYHQTKYQHLSEHLSAFKFLRGHVENNVVDKVEELFKDLCKDNSNDIVLHGDLHHDNILGSDDSWKIIDPHGYVGAPCAEIGTIMCNPIDRFPKHLAIKNIIENRLSIFNEMLSFDLARIKAWAFCLTLRSAAWDIEGFGKPNIQTIEIGMILNKLI